MYPLDAAYLSERMAGAARQQPISSTVEDQRCPPLPTRSSTRTKPPPPPRSSSASWWRRWCRTRTLRRATSRRTLKITFTGGRKYSHPRETAAFNAGRYKWVKKKMERSDVVPGVGETIVYNLGTLYGEWPDGTPFEGNRYVDRFVVRGGKIVQMDVWNDSAERLLTRNGIKA